MAMPDYWIMVLSLIACFLRRFNVPEPPQQNSIHLALPYTIPFEEVQCTLNFCDKTLHTTLVEPFPHSLSPNSLLMTGDIFSVDIEGAGIPTFVTSHSLSHTLSHTLTH